MLDSAHNAAAVPFDDRGFAYGDGVFETILVREGRPLLWPQHESRLRQGCERLGIPQPATAELQAAFACVAPLQVTKLVVTRGSGGRGYAPPDTPVPRLRWHSSPFVPSAERFAAPNQARVCQLRLGHQPLLAGIKHLNRLENVLARREWSDSACVEGLLCDNEGLLVDATAMNIGWHDGHRWLTPPITQCGVAGTLRAWLLAQGLLVQGELALADIGKVSALCVFNSVQGIWPIGQLQDALGVTVWQSTAASMALVSELSQPAHRLLGYAGCR